MKEYFTVGSDKWKTTVKVCVLIGGIIGLISGAKIFFYM
jgi:hypothetical protein